MIDIGIKNFQSIKDVSFRIKGFTVIVGKTNIGKSAIIRAIKGALRNSKGSYYIREGEKTCTVTLQDPNGFFLSWEKGKGNQYTIGNESYNNVGFEVPSELADAGFRVITTGNKDLSPQIADQFNPLFLVNETGGACADILFDISRINILNGAQRLIEKDQRNLKSTLKTRKADLQRVQEGIETLKEVPDIRARYDVLRSEGADLEELKVELTRILGLESKLKRCGIRVKSLTKIDTIVVPEEDLNSLIVEIYEIQDFHDRCKKFQPEIRSMMESDLAQIEIPTENLDADLEEARELESLSRQLIPALDSVSRLEGVESIQIPKVLELDFDSVVWMQGKIESLKTIKRQFVALEKESSEIESELRELDNEIADVKAQLKVCPLCETSLA